MIKYKRPFFLFSVKKGRVRKMMVQSLRVLTSPAENTGSIPSPHARQLTTASNSISRESKSLRWQEQESVHKWHT